MTAKRSKKTSQQTPMRTPQTGKGKLQVGNPGNKGGSGRPVSAVRLALRESFDARIGALEHLADYAVKERDRLAAIDLMARYGIGAMKEVSTEHVRDRLQQTLGIIRQVCTSAQAEQIVSALRPIWL